MSGGRRFWVWRVSTSSYFCFSEFVLEHQQSSIGKSKAGRSFGRGIKGLCYQRASTAYQSDQNDDFGENQIRDDEYRTSEADSSLKLGYESIKVSRAST